MNSSVHERGSTPQCRMLGKVRDRYADLRRDLLSWVNRSKSRLKTLHAVVSRTDRGVMYDKLQRCLDVSRRWVKELVGELRNLGVVETPSNPAFVVIPDRKLALLLKDILQTMRPSECILPPARWSPEPQVQDSKGVGNPTPSGDFPPGEISLGSGGNPTPKRR